MAAVAAACIALAFANGSTGDHPHDAGPMIDGILRGDFAHAFANQPVMGLFAVLVQLPFAALAKALGAGELTAYRLGCLPCLFALGLVGIAIGREAARRGAPRVAAIAVAALCLVNPLTWEALRLGHPEELLGTALVVAAVLAALRGYSVGAAVALGLALATKQWTVIAALPVLVAAPRKRLRIVVIAGGVVLALTLPVAVADSGSFASSSKQAGWAGTRVYPFNAVYPFAPSEDRVIDVAGETKVVTVRALPRWVAHSLHPLIVLLSIPLTAAFWLRRRRLEPHDVFALLALLFLVRCLLDPVDNAYYHVPFLVCLGAWEGLVRRRAPVFGLLASVAVWFVIYKAHVSDSFTARNAFYLLVTMPLAVWLSALAFGVRRSVPHTGRRPSAPPLEPAAAA
jgi:glycosyl transferase family 87